MIKPIRANEPRKLNAAAITATRDRNPHQTLTGIETSKTAEQQAMDESQPTPNPYRD